LLAKYSISTSFRPAPRIKLGDKLMVHGDAVVERYCTFTNSRTIPFALGSMSYTKSELSTGTSIGRYCSIGLGVSIMGDPHPLDRISTSPFTYHRGLPGVKSYLAESGVERYQTISYDKAVRDVIIEHDVWIGDGALLARGVRLGTGCVIAARAVVTRDVLPYEVIGGMPARTIRFRFPEELRERLLESAWWRYAPDVIMALDPTDLPSFLDRLDAAINRGDIQPFEPGSLTATNLRATM